MLFISGLETSLSKLKKTGKAASFSAISGVILPLLLGISVGIFFNFPLQDCIVIGLILTATSVGITVRTLLDIHVLDTDVGTTILGAAVIDDVIGIMLLAFS
ncbi:MAG: cation:proton antiporter [Candidatus Thermoplasmatota archaeon]|nr:cation:proton antiporter [Candidatus Thermoplasmatota archaeon]